MGAAIDAGERGIEESRSRTSFRVATAATVVTLLTAPFGAASATSGAEPKAAPTWQEMANATYQNFRQLGGRVTMHDGRWEGDPFAPGGAERPSLVLAPGFWLSGDLSGTGTLDAVVALSESTGGSGTLQHLAVARHSALAVEHLATLTLGDRVLLRSARIDGRRLTARIVRAGKGDALCCPGEVVDFAWRFDDGSLVQEPESVVGRFGLDTLGGSTWVLREWDVGQPAPAEIEVTFGVDGDRVVGSNGCNRYFASAKMSAAPPGSLEIGPLAGTRMVCPPPAAAVEERFQRLLGGAERATFQAGRLLLIYRDGKGDFGALVFDAR